MSDASQRVDKAKKAGEIEGPSVTQSPEGLKKTEVGQQTTASIVAELKEQEKIARGLTASDLLKQTQAAYQSSLRQMMERLRKTELSQMKAAFRGTDLPKQTQGAYLSSLRETMEQLRKTELSRMKAAFQGADLLKQTQGAYLSGLRETMEQLRKTELSRMKAAFQGADLLKQTQGAYLSGLRETMEQLRKTELSRMKAAFRGADFAKQVLGARQAIERMQLDHELLDDSSGFDESAIDELQEILAESSSTDNSRDFFEWITDTLASFEERYLQGRISKKLLNVLLQYLTILLAGLTVSWLSQKRPTSSDTYRHTNIEININLPQEIAADLMIVYRDTDVYSSSRKRRQIIDYLLAGDAVQVLEKRGKWRLVCWVESDDSTKEGWVRAKYLRHTKPLNRHFYRRNSELLQRSED